MAPPGNQAENRENKRRPNVRGVPDLLKTPGSYIQAEEDPSPWTRKGSPTDLTRWLLLQLMVEPNAVVDIKIQKFLTAYYGPGAESMGGALAFLRKQQMLPRKRYATKKPILLSYVTPDFYATLNQHFAAAEAACTSDSPELRRVQMEQVQLDVSLLNFWNKLSAKLPEGRTMPFERATVINRLDANSRAIITHFYNHHLQEKILNELSIRLRYYQKRDLPIELAGHSDRDILDVPSWKFNRMVNWHLRESTLSFVDDPESLCGKAKIYRGKMLIQNNGRVDVGLMHNTGATTMIDLKLLENSNDYQWVKLGQYFLPVAGKLWLFKPGEFKFDLDPLPSSNLFNNVWEIYISIKIDGSLAEPVAIRVDRMVLARVSMQEISPRIRLQIKGQTQPTGKKFCR